MAAGLIVATYNVMVATLIHQQRQAHLSDGFRHPQPTITDGDPMGVLQAPTIGLNEVVIEGISVDHLRGGPARMRSSALPGDPGVVVVVGHRDAYGAPFGRLDRLVAGDDVAIQARTGPIVRYVIQVVERHATIASLELPNTSSISYLLLVTGDDGWFGDEQLIVVARALPLSDVAAVVPEPAAVVPDRSPFGVGLLLASVAIGAAVMAWSFLRPRTSPVTTAIVIAPMIAVGVVFWLMVGELLTSTLR